VRVAVTEVLSIAEVGPAEARKRLERAIAAGEVVVFPADGLYGLACDPLNATAVERIQELKGRDDRKPSAVLYFSPLAFRELLGSLGPATRAAIGVLMPGPVTLVVANSERRYPFACREDPERLGIRLIEGPLAGAMCPIFQTSANLSGDAAPARLTEVAPAVTDGADLAIDGGELTGRPSTVVDLTAIDAGGDWAILRKGGMDAAEVEERMSRARRPA
jgi:L-threonylcarbamoyladenylate synthase